MRRRLTCAGSHTWRGSLVIGCPFPSLGGLNGGGADASADAGDDSGTNLVPNGTFEANCNKWVGYQADLGQDPDAHSGQFSCRVCQQAGSTTYAIDQDDGVMPVPAVGQSWHARAYVKLRAGGRPHAIGIFLRTWNALDSTQVDYAYSGDTTLSSQWQPIDVDFTDTSTTAAILDTFTSASQTQDGDCFLIDDVSVTRTH